MSKTYDPTEIAFQLLKKPKKEKFIETPHFNQVTHPNTVQQADLLFVPSDNGFKYLLVVVDLGSRLTDAEPLRTKTAKAVTNAFKKIYDDNFILRLPKIIMTDSGTEFRGETRKYFNDKKVLIKYGKPYRSRQLGLVERRNQEIGVEIFTRQLIKEIETSKVQKKWIKYIPDIIDDFNDKYKIKKKNIKPLSDDPIITK